MASQSKDFIFANRLILTLVGGVAALALWALSESWDTHLMPPMMYLALFSFVAVYSAVVLALIGPVAPVRGLLGALLIAVPTTSLLCLASLRFELATDVLDHPLVLSAWVLLGFLTTPFLSVRLQDRNRWLAYDELFENAWEMVARYLLAWGFVAVFWLVLFLSNALLELVKVSVIDMIMQTDWLRFGLSGSVLGLALAVVHEWRDRVPTFLLVRLLRLLVPVMVLVVGVFLLAIPFRGLGQVFGDFSAAGTLMATTILAVSLISVAIERSENRADLSRLIAAAVRLLILTLPVLSGLAAWALVVRVEAYGWTPERVAAATASVILMIYALGYLIAALGRKGWTDRVRRFNLGMAGLTIVVSALWMTPVLDAQAISSRNQIHRFDQGKITEKQLPLWEMAHDWGRAGDAALDGFAQRAQETGNEAFAYRIERAKGAESPFQFDLKVATETDQDLTTQLVALIPVLPEGAELDERDLQGISDFDLRRWLNGCNRSLADGRPGCVFVRGAFSPALSADRQGILLFLNRNNGVSSSHLSRPEIGPAQSSFVVDALSGKEVELNQQEFLDLVEGRFEIAPSGIHALHLGGHVLSPRN